MERYEIPEIARFDARNKTNDLNKHFITSFDSSFENLFEEIKSLVTAKLGLKMRDETKVKALTGDFVLWKF